MDFIKKIFLLCAILPICYCMKKEYLVEIWDEKPVHFAIYYDTENITSIEWFEKKFKPNYKTFESFLQFDFTSCGEITISKDEKSISCPRPDTNCYMNKLHACAYDHIKGGSKLNDFIICTFENKLDPLTKCACGDQALIKTLDDCAKGPEGLKLCLDNYYLPPPFSENPSFLGDAFYKEPFDLVDLLCKMLKLHTGKFPAVCSK